jgi:outer membrane lipoprotein-sorting protein
VLTLPPPCPRLSRMALVVAGALLVASAAWATPTAQEILRRALDLSAEVQDYTAQVQLTTNFAGAPEEVPPFTVYFKRPDKVSIKSKSLVIVPRDALTFGNLSKRIEQGADILLVGTKTVNGVPSYTLKIKPKREGGEERLLVVVDGQRWTVSRMEVAEGGHVHATFEWQHTLVQGRYWMQSVITCKVPEAPNASGGKGAEATVTFSGYKVNTGLSDSFFQSSGG